MTRRWLDALVGHLADVGLLTWQPTGPYPPDATWPAFLDHEPPEPGRLVAVTGYGGVEAGLDLEPRVQLLVRGDTDPRTSRDRAQALHDHLHFGLVGGVEIGDEATGRWWLSCAPGINGSAMFLGVDANRRHRHVTNHALTIGAL